MITSQRHKGFYHKWMMSHVHLKRRFITWREDYHNHMMQQDQATGHKWECTLPVIKSIKLLLKKNKKKKKSQNLQPSKCSSKGWGNITRIINKMQWYPRLTSIWQSNWNTRITAKKTFMSTSKLFSLKCRNSSLEFKIIQYSNFVQVWCSSVIAVVPYHIPMYNL